MNFVGRAMAGRLLLQLRAESFTYHAAKVFVSGGSRVMGANSASTRGESCAFFDTHIKAFVRAKIRFSQF
jgi:hypothetical protein